VRASGELGFVLFTDDTNLFAEGPNPAGLFERVNRGLGELGRWFKCNRLTLNLKKTEYVYFAGARPPEVPCCCCCFCWEGLPRFIHGHLASKGKVRASPVITLERLRAHTLGDHTGHGYPSVC
jgi:hypothetical protein